MSKEHNQISNNTNTEDSFVDFLDSNDINYFVNEKCIKIAPQEVINKQVDLSEVQNQLPIGLSAFHSYTTDEKRMMKIYKSAPHLITESYVAPKPSICISKAGNKKSDTNKAKAKLKEMLG